MQMAIGESTALDSDCDDRDEGYREGGICVGCVLGLSITGSVPKSQTVHTQRGREKERGREGTSQRSSSHKSKWRFATFKDTLKWSVAHVAMVHMYVVCVCVVCVAYALGI